EGPTIIGDYPGAVGHREAVFKVGSGRSSFSGAELAPNLTFGPGAEQRHSYTRHPSPHGG
ncbi:MAG: hypothetical protein ACRDZX_04150, partial [Acidimicrobiales bacterium]